MVWQSRYLPPDANIWRGRTDIPDGACFYHQIKLLNLLTETPKARPELCFAIIGFKCDEGVQRDLGRSGAFEGSTAIRLRLAKLPIQKANLCCYDAGNIICSDHDLEASQQALGDVVAILLANNIRPIVIGGGHELAWGQYLGIAKAYSLDRRLGIINFAAHFGLQPLEPSNRNSQATAFYQIAKAHSECKRPFDYNCIGLQHYANIRQTFEIAKQFKAKAVFADDLHQGLREKCVDFIDRVIDENEMLYMSLALDVLAPAFAPGVASIQPLGLEPWHVIPLIRQIAASAKVIAYDIAEHVPRYDIDHRTAKLAAILIYEIIHHHNEPHKML